MQDIRRSARALGCVEGGESARGEEGKEYFKRRERIDGIDASESRGKRALIQSVRRRRRCRIQAFKSFLQCRVVKNQRYHRDVDCRQIQCSNQANRGPSAEHHRQVSRSQGQRTLQSSSATLKPEFLLCINLIPNLLGSAGYGEFRSGFGVRKRGECDPA